jgi:hypothetical protein
MARARFKSSKSAVTVTVTVTMQAAKDSVESVGMQNASIMASHSWFLDWVTV